MAELLSPAGNFEKLKAALLYGADAVYLAGNCFGMRNAADNFTNEEIYAAAEYTHQKGKKLYLTVNTMPHGYEYPRLREYLKSLAGCPIDALIVADLGVLATVKELLPDMEIHISTQTSIVSPATALAYASLGAKRLVLARELSFDEIAEIKAVLPKDVELEAFIHGSMCVSYSGRCLLSDHICGRDANRGACAQPCRWNYTIVEEHRPDMPLDIHQNENGSFIMSSQDMCMIEHIPTLMRSGINSFKIEGRMKSAYYVAVVTNAYRMAINEYTKNPDEYKYNPLWFNELESVSHREYSSGYYLDSPSRNAQLCTKGGYIRDKAYFATVIDCEDNTIFAPMTTEKGKLYKFIQRNKVSVGEKAEIISPGKTGIGFCVEEMYSEKGENISSAPHPSMIFYVRVPFSVSVGDIMRAADLSE